MGPVVIAGGMGDPNLGCLLARASALGIPTRDLRVPAGESPAFQWSPADGAALYEDAPLQGCGAFIRHDVFAGLDHGERAEARSNGWFAAFQSWAWVAGVKVLNRDAHGVSMLKPAVLSIAPRHGLRVPRTLVTNAATALGALDRSIRWVAKPVAGGSFCEPLEPLPCVKSNAPTPAIVQRRLASPEMRLYVVGKADIAFGLNSPSLDYRVKQDVKLEEIAPPTPEAGALRSLMSELRMDFGAADFKRDPDSGGWSFLELNTSPMFAGFDRHCGGRISEAILRCLR